MIRSTHLPIQLNDDSWLVTFVSEAGISETRQMTAAEFANMVLSEAGLLN